MLRHAPYRRAWLCALAVINLGLFSQRAKGEEQPAKFTVVLFGDSISRAVIADRNLGQEASEADQESLAQFRLIAPLFPYSPEHFDILNYPLMGAFDFVVRDHLAAVQGSEPYSLAVRLRQSTGREVDVISVAHLGGSYREADTQMALFKTALAGRHLANADLAVIDLGRADFSLFPPVDEFRREVDAFITALFTASPKVRVVINRIANEVQIINRPDRLALRLPGRGDISCRQMLGETVTLGRSGLNVGQDNSKLLPEAISRYNAYNQVLLDTVARLKQAGATAAWVSTLPDRANPEDWDKIFAYDCVHINKIGQAEIADHLLPVVSQLLALPAKAPVLPKELSPSALSAHGQSLWQAYLHTQPLNRLQDGCQPELLMPSEATPYQGMVTLLHSFTACPSELHELADHLRAKGYAVVLPLLPGHGLKPDQSAGALAPWQDDLSALPLPRLVDDRNYRTEYNGLAAKLDELAAEFSGPRIVVGRSLGATVATAMTQLRPYLWQRQLLLSPFYQLSDVFQRSAFGLIVQAASDDESAWAAYGPLLAKRLDWGPGCEWSRRGAPFSHSGEPTSRAGYCQFTVGQALAASEFGYETWRLMQPTTIATQVVGVKDDGLTAADPLFNGVGRMRNEELGLLPFVTKERLHRHPDVQICYRESGEPEGWGKAAWISQLSQFVQDGSFVASDGEASINGDPVCLDP